MSSVVESSTEDSSSEPLHRAAELLLSGCLSEARSLAESVLSQTARDGPALHLLGLIDARENHTVRAVRRLEQALAFNPENASWWHNLGFTYGAAGAWGEASSVFVRGLAALPDDAMLQSGLARALLELGKPEEALSAFQRARALGADPLQTALGVAESLVSLERFENAAEVLRATIETYPNSARAHGLLADIYSVLGYSHRVRQHREEVFRLNPDDAEGMAKLSAVCWDNGELSRSLDLCGTVVARGAATASLHSFYLSGLLHHPEQTGESIRQEHERWAAIHSASVTAFDNWPNDRDPDRRLRIGYLGGDFYMNPSFHFLLPFFLNHDRRLFEIFGYDLRSRDDAGTERIRQACDEWRNCRDDDEQELTGKVRRDEVDVLVDTTGHYSRNRIRLFQRRPAPVQVTYPNYPSTTGLDCFDGIVTDRWVCPAGTEAQYSEPALSLPSGYLPYAPPSSAPPVTPLPALQNGYVTFGVFQRPVKIGQAVWDAIAGALQATPRSRILVHNAFRELDFEDSVMRNLYVRELTGRGVSVNRIEFRGPADLRDHLGILAESDIALDTFPYNGQTTTCECLWMGVPVVTLTGSHHVSRVGHSILDRAGFPEWETGSPAEYVAVAIRLAADLEKLAATRASMRHRVGASLLLDGPRITGELESGYRSLWRRWCAKRSVRQ